MVTTSMSEAAENEPKTPPDANAVDEASAFLHGRLPDVEADAYAASLKSKPARRAAVIEALGLHATARLAFADDEPVEQDAELCAGFRGLMPAFVSGGSTSRQRDHVEEHLESCRACRVALATVQRGRSVGRPAWFTAAASILLLILGVAAGWELRGGGAASVSADEPPEVMSDDLRFEVIDVVEGAPELRQVKTVAETVVSRIQIREFLRPDLSSKAVDDLVLCLQLFGRAGAGTPGTREWVRCALLHPSPDVRREAAVWYPKIDTGWRNDEHVRGLVEAGMQAKPKSAGPKIHKPKRQ
ncbi:MAG: hypothetical protein CMJ83_09780 [Planctomycetes bacterium]|nr:hypothetical protein [Planctomycetota bacterium]